jgi:CheY-like chemotaxis protein
VAKVLVLDSHSEGRVLLSRALTDEGYETLEAANARQGLDAYRVVRPALAVVDLCHGESEGLTFIRDLLAEDPDAPFLALCPDPHAARFDPLTLTDVFGAEVVVQKPQTDREVVRIVPNWGAR